MLTKLEQKYDYKELLKVYDSLIKKHNQIHISSIDGKTYWYESGDLNKYNLDQTDFVNVNTFLLKQPHVTSFYKMPELGQAYMLDTTNKHTALNLSWENRVHAVFCLK